MRAQYQHLSFSLNEIRREPLELDMRLQMGTCIHYHFKG